MDKNIEQIPMVGENPFWVLIVDDLPINLLLLERALSKMGCVCEFAENGLEALRKLDGRSFNLLFMDCQMPFMDGCTAIQEIRKSGKHARLKIICTSATKSIPGKINPRCKTCAIDGFLRKPSTNETLKNFLDSLRFQTQS